MDFSDSLLEGAPLLAFVNQVSASNSLRAFSLQCVFSATAFSQALAII